MNRRYIPSGGWLEQNEAAVLKFIAFLVILAIALVATGYADKILAFVNPDIESCRNGKCKNSCNADIEVQKFDVQCMDSAKVCCLSKEKAFSKECNGLNKGGTCGDRMICDEALKCVSMCEYCSVYPLEETCIIREGTSGRRIDFIDSDFTCGCSENECTELSSSGLGTCVKGFCPSTNPIASDYMCCNRP